MVDCREGEPDRSGAAALFEGFFDLETGDPRRFGTGHPRLRVVAPAPPPIPPTEPTLAIAPPADASPAGDASPPGAAVSDLTPAPVRPPRPAPPVVERLWGFECWWRPDPARAGLTPADHEEIEQSKVLLRGLLRDTRRRGSLQPR